ncbi:hypothetical protein P152DRAFT_69987 [Eremomyces bilateralis CBS 781.70]|uniref:J domain-containing protein n=1 Tax=Eremomyces bilateralis CBS 781.70 TaxID=1392243 RepID=A0A6G1G076_9PEZI|nr:uncharacterized protein P152DRAFT_69987 [Eremomyces bilateralis CBS 781.70]KAF1811331.1 hypothetical protein P152DRAFT_69987 [Eremomyces bilateralis CBS 781.70]
MILRKQSVLVSACNSLQCHLHAGSGNLPLLRASQQNQIQWRPIQCKKYATVASDDFLKSQNDLSGESISSQPNRQPSSFTPPPWPSQSHPTPYQVLHHSRDTPYDRNASIFPQLIKLYHPDHSLHCSHAAIQSLDPTVRLERYRLIVAAHALLSDVTKRKNYDNYGIGWAGNMENPLDRMNWTPNSSLDPRWQRAASRCATWEDWEKLREDQAREQPGAGASDAQWYDFFNSSGSSKRTEPVYFSHMTFISVMVFFTILGTGLNAIRADSFAAGYVARLDAKHDEASKHLMMARRETLSASKVLPSVEVSDQPEASQSDRDIWERNQLLKKERIEKFLQKRDPAAWKDHEVRKLVLNPEVCSPTGKRESSNLQPEHRS